MSAPVYSKRPVVIAGILTGLYAFSPLMLFCTHSAVIIQVLDMGIFIIPNGLYCLMLFSSRFAAVFALLCLWLLLWGLAYFIIRLVTPARRQIK